LHVLVVQRHPEVPKLHWRYRKYAALSDGRCWANVTEPLAELKSH